MSKDRIYRDAADQIADFAFDERVVAVFPDMIRRSVPGYETVVPISGLLAARHARSGARCYDLGCSLGATALAIVRELRVPDCEVVAVDNSEAMLEKARRTLADEPIQWVLGDLRTIPIENACAVVMNYTLQFVPPDQRASLIGRIRSGMRDDGVLIVSEKIRFPDPPDQHGPPDQDYMEAAHLDYKRANGYSELEISGKRTALENVMKPDTVQEHEQRFKTAGFSRTRIWFQCLNWASFIATP